MCAGVLVDMLCYEMQSESTFSVVYCLRTRLFVPVCTLVMLGLTPCRYMTMTPPTFWRSLFTSRFEFLRFKLMTALLTALFIWLAVTCLAGEDLVVNVF